MLRIVFTLELRRQLRAPVTWLMFASLALYTMVTMAGGETEQLAGAGVPHNGALMLQYWSMYSGFWVAVLGPLLFTAPALRDIRLRTASIVFSVPLTDGAYFWGKYTANLVVCLIVMSSIPAMMLLVSWLHRYGLFAELRFLPSMPWMQVVQAGLIWVLPACLIYGSLHYAIAMLTGRPFGSYAFAVLSMGVFTFFFVAFQADGEHRFWIEVLDPMGKQTVDGQVLHWTVAERATRLLDAKRALVVNRVIYLVLAFALLLAARWRFRMYRLLAVAEKGSVARSKRQTAAGGRSATPELSQSGSQQLVDLAQQTPLRCLRRAFWLGRWHMTISWRLLSFQMVVAGLLLIGIETGWSAAAEFFNGPEHHLLPAAQSLLTVIEPQMFMLVIMVTIYFSGELLARDHDQGVEILVQSAPLPAGLVQASHWLGVSLLAVSLSTLPAAAALLLQLAEGWLEAVPAHFARSVFIHMAPLALSYAWLTCAVYGFSGSRLLSQGLPMAVLWGGVALHEVHAVEQRLFLFGLPADLAFSDFDILGPSTARHMTLAAYYLGCSGLLATAALAWRSRTHRRLPGRLPPMLAAAAMLFAVIAFIGGGMVQRQLADHDWVPTRLALDRQADYERLYGFLQEQQNLRIQSLQLDVQWWPDRSAVRIDGRWSMVNAGRQALSRLYLSVPEASRIKELRFNGQPLQARTQDDRLQVVSYDLPQAVASGQMASLAVVMSTRTEGYTYDPPSNRVAAGSMVLDRHSLPVLGYDRRRELSSTTQRRQRRLPPRQPMFEQPDRFASATDAGLADLELHIRVPENIVVAASGVRMNERVQDGIREVDFQQRKAPLQWLVTAGRLQQRVAPWLAPDGHRTDIVIQHSPLHGFNQARMRATVEDALELFSQRFGPYSRRDLQLVEIAQFAREESIPAPSTPGAGGLVALPERAGWLHDYRREPGYDLLTYMLSREVARTWWGQIAGASAGPGAALVDEGVAGVLALELLERRNGRQAVDRYVANLQAVYLKQSALTEGSLPDVLHTQFEPYAGLQATLSLYAHRKRLGAAMFDRRLDDYFRQHAPSGGGSFPVRPKALAQALGMDIQTDLLYPERM